MPDDRRRRIEELFLRYGRGVGAYILARVGDADAAETITSNVFLIVVRRIDQCRASPAAWLWSIARSELARYFRGRRLTAPLQDTLDDPAPGPPAVAERKEMQARMGAALEKLTPPQQRIIYLKFFLDLPNAQIARELNLTASNVGVIVHRAVARLRQLMDEPATAGRGSAVERSASQPDIAIDASPAIARKSGLVSALLFLLGRCAMLAAVHAARRGGYI